MIDEIAFRQESDRALEALKQALIRAEEDGGFEAEEKNGVLYFNPGSAGPRRFSSPVTVGRLTIEEKNVNAELIELPA